MQKPDYRVPLMSEIAALPWNGFNAISTFSGCGGSSLGYKMAGFKMLWANEFIPAAQDTYRANHPQTILNTKDIRQVAAQEILDTIKMQPGELDLFDGSPPCASFSTAGKREAGWGKVKKYSDTTQRTDDLFFEFARLVEGVQPKVFVAENVSGLVKGTAKGYFLEILARLKSCGYNVKCQVLDAQWLGVPQMRQRTIFIGVRNDLELTPVHPKPLPYRVTLSEAWRELPARNTDCWTMPDGKCKKLWENSKQGDSFSVANERLFKSGSMFCHYRSSLNQPANSIKQSTQDIYHPTEPRSVSIAELKRICSFPDDFIFTGSFSQKWERMARAVPPVMMSHVAATIRDEILAKVRE